MVDREAEAHELAINWMKLVDPAAADRINVLLQDFDVCTPATFEQFDVIYLGVSTYPTNDSSSFHIVGKRRKRRTAPDSHLGQSRFSLTQKCMASCSNGRRCLRTALPSLSTSSFACRGSQECSNLSSSSQYRQQCAFGSEAGCACSCEAGIDMT